MQRERLQFRQVGEVTNTLIRNFGALQSQVFEAEKVAKMHHPGIGDDRAIEDRGGRG